MKIETQYFILKEGVLIKSMSNHCFVLSKEGGLVSEVNNTVEFILIFLQKKRKNVEEIVKELCNEFDVDPDQARQDVLDLLQDLLLNEIILEATTE